MWKRVAKLIAAAAAVAVLAAPVLADVVDDIKKRGKLIIGTKADYRPYGYRDIDGRIVGLEPDLAKDIADTLGVGLEVVPVVASNRMQFLLQGRIDLLVATMSDTPERRKVVWIVDPGYYSSGSNVLAAKTLGLKRWEDLRARRVCGIQGAIYNRRVQEDLGAEVVAFKGVAEAHGALRQGRCVAFVYDDAAIVPLLLYEPEWAAYEMPLETLDYVPWGMAVRFGEHRFYGMVSEMIQKWHGTGRILDLEAKWAIKKTSFAVEMNRKYKQ